MTDAYGYDIHRISIVFSLQRGLRHCLSSDGRQCESLDTRDRQDAWTRALFVVLLENGIINQHFKTHRKNEKSIFNRFNAAVRHNDVFR